MRSGTPSATKTKSLHHISIHPLRAEWDNTPFIWSRTLLHFNPPTPCGVGRRPVGQLRIVKNFNPPTPCGVGPAPTSDFPGRRYFNPPTPCGVGLQQQGQQPCRVAFQSTHSVRSGTAQPGQDAYEIAISIHPLRAEWDKTTPRSSPRLFNFNPPTPCGVGLSCTFQ